MKKIFIVFFLIISYAVNSQFIPSTGDVLVYNTSDYFNENRHDTTFTWVTGQDTLVNGELCKKMSSYFSHCKSAFRESYIYEKDSVVFFSKVDSTSFDTLYDFTKKKNEHWKINLTNNKYLIVQVDSVYQKTIQGKLYKTLGVTYFYFERVYKVINGVVTRTDDFVNVFDYCSQVVERIGDISDFFNLITSESDCFGPGLYINRGLSKYISDSDTISIEGVFDYCQPQKIVGVSKLKNFRQLNCSPNPTTGILHISGLENQDLESYQLFSATGQQIEIELNSSHLDATKLGEGIYFLRLNFAQGAQTLKFVKE